MYSRVADRIWKKKMSSGRVCGCKSGVNIEFTSLSIEEQKTLSYDSFFFFFFFNRNGARL